MESATAPYIDYNVSGYDPLPHFNPPETLPGTTLGTETDNFAVTATGTIVVPSAGTYTFGVNSDDGFQLIITGASFTSTTNATASSEINGNYDLEYSGGRGGADTFGVVTFPTAGDYPISLLWFQGGGGAECELFAAAGSFTGFDASMELVGDAADGGLGLLASYVAPPFTVGVNSEETNGASPALAGTISDPAASVMVRVNGTYYAATNNGSGTWSLPAGEISLPSPAAGTYNVLVTGTNASGIQAFNSAVNALTIATASPTVAVTAPASPTLTPVGSISINFSEPVEDFTLADLQLTLADGGPAASQPLEGATLTSSDNQHWTLGNLAGLNTAAGTYTLTLSDADWGLSDDYGNLLMTGSGTTWTRSGPAVTSIATSGPTITNAASVQYTVTFNESMTGVAVSDFALATSGASGTIASVSGSGSSYTVTVNNVSGNGTLGLNLAANSTIVDQYDNPLNTSFTGQFYTIDTTGPTVAMSASTAPSVVSGTTTGLSVLGADVATGQSALTYTWTATSLPAGAVMPAFSVNGVNAAQNTTATFSKAGNYTFQVTITDSLNLTTTSSVSVTVSQVLTFDQRFRPAAVGHGPGPVRQRSGQPAEFQRRR